MLKIISSLLLITVILGNITVFAEENNVTKCIEQKGYNLYKCQFKNICKTEEYGLNTDKIVKLDKEKGGYYEKEIPYEKVKKGFVITEGFENSILDIEKVKYLYKENQNNIYKCSIINSQLLAFSDIKKILNSTDKTGILKERLVKKLELKEKKLKKIIEKNKCSIVKKNGKNKAIKKILLDQSTLELCNYKYYLSYLYTKSKGDLTKVLGDKKEISALSVEKTINKQQNEILNEMKHSFKMYPLAFDTYIQYDSFLKLHIVLELLKEDYRVFRDKLYLTLRPINQVVYKIINAQSK